MKLLGKSKRAAEDHGLPIEVQVGLKMETGDTLGRIRRRLVDKEIRKIVARHGSLVHPETGERPTALFYMPTPASAGTLRIKTDSEPLRAWLVAKGVAVHGEVREGEEGHAPAARPVSADPSA